MNLPRYYDAHCHWQSDRLLPYSGQIGRDLETVELARAVVNGTCPQDWHAVAALARADARVLPAFGLHPWQVNAECARDAQYSQGNMAADSAHLPNTSTTGSTTCPPMHQPSASGQSSNPPAVPEWQWLETLKQLLHEFPQAAIGEIGLDNWIKDADKALQQQAFLAQLALAAAGNRPVSIHCLRADGDLLAALKAAPALPARGIHLHGFAGSVETARQLLDIGAYFSFSEYITEPKRVKARAVAEYTPLERLLAETDAPDMIGAQEWQHYRLGSTLQTEEKPIALQYPANGGGNSTHGTAPPHSVTVSPIDPPAKHPANITAAYACLAELRGLPLNELTTLIEENFLRYFES